MLKVVMEAAIDQDVYRAYRTSQYHRLSDYEEDCTNYSGHEVPRQRFGEAQ